MHHLLLQCKYSTAIWNHVYQEIQTKYGVRMELSPTEIVLGVEGMIHGNFYNHISIVVKQYKYACRCLGQIPMKDIASNKIKQARDTELALAIKNGKMEHFNNKWQLLQI